MGRPFLNNSKQHLSDSSQLIAIGGFVEPARSSCDLALCIRNLPLFHRKMDDEQAGALLRIGSRLAIDLFGLLRDKALMFCFHFGPPVDQSNPRSRNVKGPPKKAG
jgi:hypothetical protein